MLAAARERAEREREKRAKLEAGALSYDLDGLRAARRAVTEPIHDVARIGHAELLTPKPEESLRFFVDVLGHGGGGARGAVGLPARLGRLPPLQPEAHRGAAGRARPHRAARVEPGGARAASRGDRGERARQRLDRGRRRPRPRLPLHRPRRARLRALLRGRALPAPEHLRPSWRNQPQRYVGRGAAVKRLDHVNVLAADVRANRVFAQDVLGYRLYERIELDDGTEAGAWLSVSIAAHELIYVEGCATARSGRLHHLAFWVDTREECLRAADIFVDNDVPIEAAPSKHGVAQGFFLYGFEPGGNRIEVTTGGYFVYDPDFEPIVWTAAERARGQYWGVQTIESFHTYGTPDVAGAARR